MNGPVSGSATASVKGLIEIVDRVQNYFSGYKPDMKTVSYNYGQQTSKMKLKIHVPDGKNRLTGNVEIPRKGYEFSNIFTNTFEPVRAGVEKRPDKIVINPRELPANEEYLVELTKNNVNIDTLNKIVEIKEARQPERRGGKEVYWLDSYIKEPAVLEDIYDELTVENVDLNINVEVQRCFSQAIPDDVIKGYKRTIELIESSNKGDAHDVRKAHQLRKGTMEYSNSDLSKVSNIIHSLTDTESVSPYISLDNPYRKETIRSENYEDFLLPEALNVGVSTDLGLDQISAEGEMEFHREEYQDHIREQTSELLD